MVAVGRGPRRWQSVVAPRLPPLARGANDRTMVMICIIIMIIMIMVIVIIIIIVMLMIRVIMDTNSLITMIIVDYWMLHLSRRREESRMAPVAGVHVLVRRPGLRMRQIHDVTM